MGKQQAWNEEQQTGERGNDSRFWCQQTGLKKCPVNDKRTRNDNQDGGDYARRIASKQDSLSDMRMHMQEQYA
jgi:hypothetical protein